MSNRREFIAQALAASGISAITGSQAHAKRLDKPKRMRVLVLGATGFLGPHYVRAALDRGHRVSAFVRNGDTAERTLPANVERLLGDRNGDLKSIQNRDWDAVIDVATYGPGWVRSLGEALQGRVRHYTFISTIGVYDVPKDGSVNVDETCKLAEYKGSEDPYTLTSFGKYYGPLKALCELEAERQFPGKTLIVRPCYIVGPNDRVGALTYWALRMEKGGEVLAAGDPLAPVHIIDARDKAKWAVEMAERGGAGAFSAVGPAEPINWGMLLKVLRSLSVTPTKPTWVPVSWLAEQKINNSFSSLLFWAGSSERHLISNAKARAAGLAPRPLITTVTETLEWYNALPVDQKAKFLMGVEEKMTLDESMARERALLARWHEDAGTRTNEA